MKKWADKNRRLREFQVRDLVLVKMYVYTLNGRHQGLIWEYEGSLLIVRKLGLKLIRWNFL